MPPIQAAPGTAAETTRSRMLVRAVTGSHELAIDGYTLSKEIDKQQFIRSSSFCAAGHLWSILYYPNGNILENYEWISMYLELVSSSSRDVMARFTFSLLNEEGVPLVIRSNSTDNRMPFCSMLEKKGVPMFITRRTLEKLGCLVDDCFRVRCSITVLKVTGRDETTGIRLVDVPPSTMDQDLPRLLTNEEGTDVTFEVSGETFAAHRNILAARSPVFMAEFFGPMKGDVTCARIDDMEACVFKALLHFIYTDSLPVIKDGESMVMSEHLLVAADTYNLERLKRICEDNLCYYIDASSVGTILALAEQHFCHGLKKACLEFLMSGDNLKAALGTNGFEHLANSCPSVLMELLAKVNP